MARSRRRCPRLSLRPCTRPARCWLAEWSPNHRFSAGIEWPAANSPECRTRSERTTPKVLNSSISHQPPTHDPARARSRRSRRGRRPTARAHLEPVGPRAPVRNAPACPARRLGRERSGAPRRGACRRLGAGRVPTLSPACHDVFLLAGGFLSTLPGSSCRPPGQRVWSDRSSHSRGRAAPRGGDSRSSSAPTRSRGRVSP